MFYTDLHSNVEIIIMFMLLLKNLDEIKKYEARSIFKK